jgi:hypothetical protein
MNDALLERMRENLKWFSGEALQRAGETAETAETVDYQWQGDVVVISMAREGDRSSAQAGSRR